MPAWMTKQHGGVASAAVGQGAENGSEKVGQLVASKSLFFTLLFFGTAE
jgi:hypothetical protein